MLNPPYDWIPAFAGMTEESVILRRTGSLRVSLSSILLSPKMEHPSQAEWGTKGG